MRNWRNTGSSLLPFGVTVGLLVFWEAAVRALGIRSIVLPPPSEIAAVIVARYDVLFSNLWPSLILTLVGFALSVIGGVAFAILITYSEFMRKGVYPVIVVSQIVPKIAIAPLFIAWFGSGAVPGLLLAFLITFFPMTINATMGFQSVDDDILKMARSFMGSRWKVFWKVRMPNALPHIFAGMKISITLAIIGVIVSEFVASQDGIGYLIKFAGGLLDTPLMMAAIVLLSVSGLIFYWVIVEAEKRIVYWRTPLESLQDGGG